MMEQTGDCLLFCINTLPKFVVVIVFRYVDLRPTAHDPFPATCARVFPLSDLREMAANKFVVKLNDDKQEII